LNLKEATTFPLVVFFVFGHKANTQMSFCLGSLITFETEIHETLKAHFFFQTFNWIKIFKKIIVLIMSFNDMWHVTCTYENLGDSSLLMVVNQIANLTLDLFFGHNLCFKYSNGLCEPILNIFVLKKFQWYKKIFNPMNFDPCNYLLIFFESIKTPIPNMGIHLGVHLRVWGLFPHILLHSW
jgi:hypothetical protein